MATETLYYRDDETLSTHYGNVECPHCKKIFKIR